MMSRRLSLSLVAPGPPRAIIEVIAIIGQKAKRKTESPLSAKIMKCLVSIVIYWVPSVSRYYCIQSGSRSREYGYALDTNHMVLAGQVNPNQRSTAETR